METVVVEANNGGLIVEIGKDIRGFIPTSQLDASRVYIDGVRQVGKDISSKVQKRLNSLVGDKIQTRIIELDREKNRIILSEKMVTQSRDLEQREKTLNKVKEGDILEGTVSGITPFGVFEKIKDAALVLDVPKGTIWARLRNRNMPDWRYKE